MVTLDIGPLRENQVTRESFGFTQSPIDTDYFGLIRLLTYVPLDSGFCELLVFDFGNVVGKAKR